MVEAASSIDDLSPETIEAMVEAGVKYLDDLKEPIKSKSMGVGPWDVKQSSSPEWKDEKHVERPTLQEIAMHLMEQRDDGKLFCIKTMYFYVALH